MTKLNKIFDRRESIRICMRWLAFVVIMVAGGRLVLKRFDKTESKNNCNIVQLCTECRAFSNCNLPEATATKEGLIRQQGQALK